MSKTGHATKASPRGKGDHNVVLTLDNDKVGTKADAVPGGGGRHTTGDVELTVQNNPVRDEHLIEKFSPRNVKGPDLHKVNQNGEMNVVTNDIEESNNVLNDKDFDFQRTMSFWSAIFFVQGSVLFFIGSIVMYPAILRGEVDTSAYEAAEALYTAGSITLAEWEAVEISYEEDEEIKEMKSKAWIEYAFMIGAWIFTVSMYLIYFLIINAEYKLEDLEGKANKEDLQHADKDGDGVITNEELHAEMAQNDRFKESMGRCCRYKYFAIPNFMKGGALELGTLSALSNFLGSGWYNVNTMVSLYGKKTWSINTIGDDGGYSGVDQSEKNWWYWGTGIIGSVFFIVAAILEGEHNGWRRCELARWNPAKHKDALPLIGSVMNTFGSVLFLLGYAVYYNNWIGQKDANCGCNDHYIWLVCTTFTVGSLCFTVSSYFGLWMWKCQQFGLGKAKHLDNNDKHEKKPVDWGQQSFLLLYNGAICIQWLLLGFISSYYWQFHDHKFRTMWFVEIGFKLFVYFCIIFLSSGVHSIEHKRPPMNFLIYILRGIAIYGFISDSYTLHTFANMKYSNLPL